MKDLNVEITASSIENFNKAEKLLRTLPIQILEQIESVKFGVVGLDCFIRYKYEPKQRIFLPDYTSQISDFDDYIGIYANDFFFKITGDLYKQGKFEYVFVKENKKDV